MRGGGGGGGCVSSYDHLQLALQSTELEGPFPSPVAPERKGERGERKSRERQGRRETGEERWEERETGEERWEERETGEERERGEREWGIVQCH